MEVLFSLALALGTAGSILGFVLALRQDANSGSGSGCARTATWMISLLLLAGTIVLLDLNRPSDNAKGAQPVQTAANSIASQQRTAAVQSDTAARSSSRSATATAPPDVSDSSPRSAQRQNTTIAGLQLTPSLPPTIIRKGSTRQPLRRLATRGLTFELTDCAFYDDDAWVYCFVNIRNTRTVSRVVRVFDSTTAFDSSGSAVTAAHCWLGNDEGAFWAAATLAPDVNYQMIAAFRQLEHWRTLRFVEFNCDEGIDDPKARFSVGFKEVLVVKKFGPSPRVPGPYFPPP